VDRKHSIDDANGKYDELLDKIKSMKPGGGSDVSDADKAKWDKNCVKTVDL